jgi:hypothetical protein
MSMQSEWVIRRTDRHTSEKAYLKEKIIDGRRLSRDERKKKRAVLFHQLVENITCVFTWWKRGKAHWRDIEIWSRFVLFRKVHLHITTASAVCVSHISGLISLAKRVRQRKRQLLSRLFLLFVKVCTYLGFQVWHWIYWVMLYHEHGA